MVERLKISSGPELIPAGYMYKSVIARPSYLLAPHVVDIYSVGECNPEVSSTNFCFYINHWRHNGFGFFNNPEIMHEIALLKHIDLTPMTLFYYEIYLCIRSFDIFGDQIPNCLNQI